MRILLIEDDKDLAQTIRDELRIDYVIDISSKGYEGIELAYLNDYDLIIIDIVLPDTDGISVCRAIRKSGVIAPILFLTAKDGVASKVIALDGGADDYLIKPVSFAELKARIRALMRRQSSQYRTNVLAVGDLTLDLTHRVVKRGKITIRLRRKELAILEYLMRNAGRVVTRDMILDHVWDGSSESFHNIVDVHMKFLRDRIDKRFRKKLIKTLHGIGYKIDA